ncbi:helix-turn-helix domain-containing protein [Tepidibacillus decaturensis]|nr:helix-turn-helix domain-containing protein [Tepidibacillus decaturensis]
MFGKRLKNIREKKKSSDSKWTQEYVADLIGVARSTYTAYENGTKQPPLETVNKIADLFGVSTDWLLGRDSTSSSHDELDEEIKKLLNDPENGIFFKDYLSAPEEKKKQLRDFMKFLLEQEKDRKPGDKQK